MNWQAIGAVGEILGAVAVLVTSRAVMHNQIATEYNRLHEITMAHPHTADVMARAGAFVGAWWNGKAQYLFPPEFRRVIETAQLPPLPSGPPVHASRVPPMPGGHRD
jgi:hypothetical protein